MPQLRPLRDAYAQAPSLLWHLAPRSPLTPALPTTLQKPLGEAVGMAPVYAAQQAAVPEKLLSASPHQSSPPAAASPVPSHPVAASPGVSVAMVSEVLGSPSSASMQARAHELVYGASQRRFLPDRGSPTRLVPKQEQGQPSHLTPPNPSIPLPRCDPDSSPPSPPWARQGSMVRPAS